MKQTVKIIKESLETEIQKKLEKKDNLIKQANTKLEASEM